MVFIPKEQIDLVTKQVDIVQLIQEYVHLKKSGQNFLGLCPFHQEKTPSFVVSAGKQNYNCYGCGAYGTALNFLMNLENYTFIEAVYKLAERAGVTLEVTKDSQQFQAQNELEECLNKSNQFYVNNLKKSQENSAVSKYLEERKVLQKQIDSFQVGYALPEWRSLQTHLQKNSLSNEIQERCGLIKKGEKGNFYDRMRNRVIFPIRNISGKLLGFAGRAIGDEKPKYLNPPETELYKKSSTFYGIYEAQESIRKKSQLIIVEGYLDVIRLSEQGWHEALATCGTALTNGHIGFIQQRLRPQNIFLLFDGDQAGIKAAEKSVKLFLANNQDSRVVLLPDGFDPDDYFKQYTPKDFQQLLDQSKKDYEFLIQQVYQRVKGGGIEQQNQAIQELLDLVKERNVIKQDLFLTSISHIFQVDKRVLQKEGKISRQNNQNFVKKHSVTVQSLQQNWVFTKAQKKEVNTLRYLISNPKGISTARTNLKANDFTHNILGELYQRFLNIEDEDFHHLKPQDFPVLFVEFGQFITHLLQTETAFSETRINQTEIIEEYHSQTFEKLIYDQKKQNIESFYQKELKKPGGSLSADLFQKRKALLHEIRFLNHRTRSL